MSIIKIIWFSADIIDMSERFKMLIREEHDNVTVYKDS